MTADLAAAIASVPVAALAELRATLYAAHAAGQINDAEAERLDAAIEARRQGRAPNRPAGVALGAVLARVTIFPPRRRVPVADRAAARQQRRLIARSGPMPPRLAARFTEGELAALGVVGDEIAARGHCRLSVAEIAKRAGVCVRLVQKAVRLAELDGLISVERRERKGDRHLTNVVRVLSREWAAWLAKRRDLGESRAAPLDMKGFLTGRNRPGGSGATGYRGGISDPAADKRRAAAAVNGPARRFGDLAI